MVDLVRTCSGLAGLIGWRGKLRVPKGDSNDVKEERAVLQKSTSGAHRFAQQRKVLEPVSIAARAHMNSGICVRTDVSAVRFDVGRV